MYRRLTLFLLPLVATIIIQEFGIQFLNGGLARMVDATQNLAAYGFAWGLVLLFASPLAQAKQMSLVLVEDQFSFRQVGLFVLCAGAGLSLLQLGLSISAAGIWLVEDLHRIEGQVARLSLLLLLWLAPVPLLRSLTLFFTGILIRQRRTAEVSLATFCSISLGIAAVFLLLPLDFVARRPHWLPILVTYVMVLSELGVVGWVFWRSISLGRVEAPGHDSKKITFHYIFVFFWPLAFIMLIQDLSRPLINLFVARGPDGTVSLAVLAIAYALGQWPYRWLNEIRNMPSAFQHEDPDLHHIRRFTVGAGFISFGIAAALFWTPVRHFILDVLMSVDAELAARAITPLAIYVCFCWVVTWRAYLHGVGLLERKTRAMAPSAPLRLLAVLTGLITLSALGIQGATLGVAALLCGFVVETLTVWWGVRGRALMHARRRAIRAAS